MRFYTHQHQFSCGIDLHARTMSLCVLNQAGAILLYRQMKAVPERFLKAIAPDREDLVVCVECLCTWDLARGPLRPRRQSLRPRPRPLHEGHPWGQGETRHD
jgi:hypothetical protein